QFVEVVEATRLFTKYKGTYMTVDQYVTLLKEPGWPTLRAASDSGQLAFDYRECVKYYNFDTKRNNGQIDEVWVFAAPYLAMYESQLMGPNAFWWNSPPIKDGTALTKLLSVMGLNYERGVDQAFHSFGHRTESAIAQAYRNAQGKPWNPKSTTPTPWDLFTRVEKDMPGLAHVGNIHFPPNGVKDYDYGNQTFVRSYAENWYRYPYLFNMSQQVNVSTWYYTPGEPLAEGLDHLGYLRWWYGHLPRYAGVTDGVLNNWWYYVVDFEAAEALAKSTSVSQPIPVNTGKPEGYRLEQNYPNPFNPSTTIELGLAERSPMTVEVFNVLGQRVRTLAEGTFDAGTYRLSFDGNGLSSGLYYYRLTTPEWVRTRTMAMVK
ncbi:MAG TPA: T9SS type A sorting domain-containing protein, partial [Bacteroidota bacterium]|nr:T9SS type A sorting domain-containing protein [Bacteroidota bacterium]